MCFFLFLGVIPLCCSNPQTLHQEFWDHHHLHSTLEDLLLGPEVTSAGTCLHQPSFHARFFGDFFFFTPVLISYQCFKTTKENARTEILWPGD